MNKTILEKWLLFFLAVAFLSESLAWAEAAVPTRYEYYNVQGSSKDETRQAMQRQAGRFGGGHFASTEWNIRWNYKSEPSGEGCRVASSQVAEDIVFHLPRWSNPPVKLKRDWEKFMKALQTHEDGHAQIGKECANEVEQKMQNLGTSPNCGQLGAELSRVVNMTISEYRRKEADYDSRTNHGMKQGAAW